MYTVTISERGKPPVKLDFDKPEITIGRVRGNDIVLQKNNVSKRHAKLIVKDGQFIIIDQKSTNGTIVNARKITAPQVVREDDKICIGDFILTLKHEERPVPRVTPPPPSPPSAGPPPLRPPPVELPRPSAAIGPSDPTRRPEYALPPAPAPPPPVAPAPPPPAAPAPPPPAAAERPPSQRSVPSPPPPLAEGPPVEPLGFAPRARTPGPMPPAPEPPPASITMKPGKPPHAVADLREQRPSEPAGEGLVDHRGRPEPIPRRSTLAGFGQVSPQGPIPTYPRPAETPGEPARPVLVYEAVPARPRVDRPALSAGMKVPSSPSPALEEAQGHALDKLLDRSALESIPRVYPPDPADLAEFERKADRTLDELASEGRLKDVDRRELLGLLTFELLGLGPLEFYLDDPDVTEVFANQPNRIYLRHEGESRAAALRFGDRRSYDLAVQRLVDLGRSVDEHLATVRLVDGTRIDVVLPPVAAQYPAITIRKVPRRWRKLDQLVEAELLSREMATFLRHAVEAQRTLLVAGPPRSGKTELLRALGAELEDGTRIITVEETAALRLPQASVLSLESADLGADRSRIIAYALRLAPERLIVDGLDPHSSYDWILGSAYAALGSIAAITANGERDALARLETMAIPATPHHSIRGLREQIARAVHFIVVLGAPAGPPNRITKLIEVQGLELDTFRLQDVFYFQSSGDDRGGAFHPTGHVPAFYEELRRGGAPADLSIFRT